eukprot:14702718-Ditylum_brightwellii.AAC.1
MQQLQLDMDDTKENKEDKVMIVETTDDDWIYSIGSKINPAETKHPNKWKGCSILGWHLMQARNVVSGIDDGCGCGKDTGCIVMLVE